MTPYWHIFAHLGAEITKLQRPWKNTVINWSAVWGNFSVVVTISWYPIYILCNVMRPIMHTSTMEKDQTKTSSAWKNIRYLSNIWCVSEDRYLSGIWHLSGIRYLFNICYLSDLQHLSTGSNISSMNATSSHPHIPPQLSTRHPLSLLDFRSLCDVHYLSAGGSNFRLICNAS